MNFFFIMRSVLFEGLTHEEVESLLPTLDAELRHYEKDEVIYSAGQTIRKLGLILEGDVRIEHVSLWGDIEILTIMEQGKTFGEASACAHGIDLLVDYVADRRTKVLFIDVSKILREDEASHSKRAVIAANLTTLLARRNLELSRRAFVMTNRTIRTKVLSYLSTAARAYGSRSFQIPYNRQQLASYLGVDRSALSAELSRMKDEGLIDYKKNHFELMDR